MSRVPCPEPWFVYDPAAIAADGKRGAVRPAEHPESCRCRGLRRLRVRA